MKLLFCLYFSLIFVRIGEAAELGSVTCKTIGLPLFTVTVLFLFVFAFVFPEGIRVMKGRRKALRFCQVIQEGLLFPVFCHLAFRAALQATLPPFLTFGAKLALFVTIFGAVQFALALCTYYLRIEIFERR